VFALCTYSVTRGITTGLLLMGTLCCLNFFF
jgi:hypothetical protein